MQQQQQAAPSAAHLVNAQRLQRQPQQQLVPKQLQHLHVRHAGTAARRHRQLVHMQALHSTSSGSSQKRVHGRRHGGCSGSSSERAGAGARTHHGSSSSSMWRARRPAARCMRTWPPAALITSSRRCDAAAKPPAAAAWRRASPCCCRCLLALASRTCCTSSRWLQLILTSAAPLAGRQNISRYDDRSNTLYNMLCVLSSSALWVPSSNSMNPGWTTGSQTDAPAAQKRAPGAKELRGSSDGLVAAGAAARLSSPCMHACSRRRSIELQPA